MIGTVLKFNKKIKKFCKHVNLLNNKHLLRKRNWNELLANDFKFENRMSISGDRKKKHWSIENEHNVLLTNFS